MEILCRIHCIGAIRPTRDLRTLIAARAFRAAYDHQKERACTERGMATSHDGSHWLRASIDSVALNYALTLADHLLIGSRRATPPIAFRSAGRIA